MATTKTTAPKKRPPRTSARQSKAPESVPPETPAVHDDLREFGAAYYSSKRPRLMPTFWTGIVVVLVAACIGIVAGLAANNGLFSGWRGHATLNSYYAVFLSNGQTYFGTIESESSDSIFLSNVYYVQLVDQEVPAEEEGGEPQIVQTPQLFKKGDEFYGPTGIVRVNRQQVTVIEELRSDSPVLQQILASR